MPQFDEQAMKDLIVETLDHASAPPGSDRWMATAVPLDRLYGSGDNGDVWIFTTLICQKIVEMLGLADQMCPCGNPDHKPGFDVGFVTLDDDGKPDTRKVISADDEEFEKLPQEMQDKAPVARFMAKLIACEVQDDNAASMEVWRDVIESGHMVDLVRMTVAQAGQIRRTMLGAQGAN